MKAFSDITNYSRPFTRRSTCSRTSLRSSNSAIRGKKGSGLPGAISAKSWAVVEGESGKVMFGRNYCEAMEIASLTKIMNCYTALPVSYTHLTLPTICSV
eukprot:TRINITY_DN12846_c0_g2_i1.p1 TRINITY_DN12846_c0_g2~~TRINITY_DN12846_c0_g2_i1.p1  ORF type:complete len:100 (+),score=17.31 TRINITY_DN12846_c0_g2_i1:47-346(+)